MDHASYAKRRTTPVEDITHTHAQSICGCGGCISRCGKNGEYKGRIRVYVNISGSLSHVKGKMTGIKVFVFVGQCIPECPYRRMDGMQSPGQ